MYSKLLTLCLAAIKKHLIKYSEKVYERSGKNLFWCIKNSGEVLPCFALPYLALLCTALPCPAPPCPALPLPPVCFGKSLESESELFTGDTSELQSFTRTRTRVLVPSSHQRSELSNTILSTFSRGDKRVWKCIPIPNVLGEKLHL